MRPEGSAFLPLITLSNLALPANIRRPFPRGPSYERLFRTAFIIIAQLIVGDEILWQRISIGVLGFENCSLTVFLCPRFCSYAFKRVLSPSRLLSQTHPRTVSLLQLPRKLIAFKGPYITARPPPPDLKGIQSGSPFYPLRNPTSHSSLSTLFQNG